MLRQPANRERDYTLMINCNGGISPNVANDRIPCVLFHGDLFLFDPKMKATDVNAVYDYNRSYKQGDYRMFGNGKELPVDNIQGSNIDNYKIFVLGGKYDYSREERNNIQNLYNMINTGSNRARVEIVQMKTSVDQNINFNSSIFTKSGYMSLKESNNKVWNMIEYKWGAAFILTVIIHDGLINKQLTTSISQSFHKRLDDFDREQIKFADETFLFGMPEYKKNIGEILDSKYRTSQRSFKELLADNKDFIEATNELTHKDVIINVHVLPKRFINYIQ